MTIELKTIPLASDHGGYEMKTFLAEKLRIAGYEVIDFGTHSSESVDYPDMIHPLADAVAKGKFPLGIIMCGSGNGAQLAANKHKGVRAALCWNVELARLAREHNDANILSLPGRFIAFDLAWEMVQVFLSTSFEGGRHDKRVKKIEI